MIRTVLALLMIMGAQNAFAQQGVFCGDAERLTEGLRGGYGEHMLATGFVKREKKMTEDRLIFYANPVTGTWSMGIRHGSETCLVAVGEGVEFHAPEAEPAGPEL